MRIVASTAGRKGDVRDATAKLNLTATEPWEVALLTNLRRVLLGQQGEPEFEKARVALRDVWLRKVEGDTQ